MRKLLNKRDIVIIISQTDDEYVVKAKHRPTGITAYGYEKHRKDAEECALTILEHAVGSRDRLENFPYCDCCCGAEDCHQ